MKKNNKKVNTAALLAPWLRHFSDHTPYPFRYVTDFYDFSLSDIAEICFVTPRTVMRWGDNPPGWVLPLLLAYHGFMLRPEWQGWRVFQDGGLIHHSATSTKNHTIKPWHVNDFAYTLSIIRGSAQSEAARLAQTMLKEMTEGNKTNIISLDIQKIKRGLKV